MKYTPIDEARAARGLRLTLTSGVPAPWSEAAKAIFRIKDIPFIAVEQLMGTENEALVEWTWHRNAPTAMYDDEPPRANWLDILNLAERLQPQPSLVPADLEDRILAYGLTNELAGERGLAWNARKLIFRSMVDKSGEDVAAGNIMFRDYGYRGESVADLAQGLIGVLVKLDGQLQSQLAAGRRYLVGEHVSVADIYFSCFSQFFAPLPPEVNPMPDFLYRAWGVVGATVKAAGYELSPQLLELRDHVFEEHIGLPLDF